MEQITIDDEIADLILKVLESNKGKPTKTEIILKQVRIHHKNCTIDTVAMICAPLREYGMIQMMRNAKTKRPLGFHITTNGMIVNKEGGWLKKANFLLEERLKKEQREINQAKLTEQQLRSIKVSKRLSVSAIIISIAALLWSIIQVIWFSGSK